MNPDGSSCYPSVRGIAERAGVNKDTVTRHLDLAEDAGWIRRESVFTDRRWRRCSYMPLIPFELSDETGQLEGATCPMGPDSLADEVSDETGQPTPRAVRSDGLKVSDPVGLIRPETGTTTTPPIPPDGRVETREKLDATSEPDRPHPRVAAVAGEHVAPAGGAPALTAADRETLSELVMGAWWLGRSSPILGRGIGDELALLESIAPARGADCLPVFVRGFRALVEAGELMACNPGAPFSGGLVNRVIETDGAYFDRALSADPGESGPGSDRLNGLVQGLADEMRAEVGR